MEQVEEAKVDPVPEFSRYTVRNSIFRLRTNRVDERNRKNVDYIWNAIRSQLQPGEDVYNFTFEWDVMPDDPLTVIRKGEWLVMKKELYPDAYDKQEPVEVEITLFTGQK